MQRYVARRTIAGHGCTVHYVILGPGCARVRVHGSGGLLAEARGGKREAEANAIITAEQRLTRGWARRRANWKAQQSGYERRRLERGLR